jgi:hypothetical protein
LARFNCERCLQLLWQLLKYYSGYMIDFTKHYFTHYIKTVNNHNGWSNCHTFPEFCIGCVKYMCQKFLIYKHSPATMHYFIKFVWIFATFLSTVYHAFYEKLYAVKSLNSVVHGTVNCEHKTVYITRVNSYLHYTVLGQSSSIEGLQ